MASFRVPADDDATRLLALMSAPLTQRLQQNDPSLTELGGFGRHTVDEVSSALVTNTTVTAFKFISYGLDDDDCTTIMRGLASRHAYQLNNLCVTCRPRTKKISFARNNIGADGAKQIARFLCASSVEFLGQEQTDSDISLKLKCKLCGKSRLLGPRFMEDFIRIELLSNKIGDEGAAAVAHSISAFNASGSRSHCIIELGLERNKITDFGMVPVCNMLQTNHSLFTLHLGRNSITHKGMICLSEALKNNNTLEVLSLTGNSAIGDEGAKILAAALKDNKTLKNLLLKKCGISDNGATHLIKALYCDDSPEDIVDNSNHTLLEVTLCEKNVCYQSSWKTLPLRTILGWNDMGITTANRLKVRFYLCSNHGVRYVHSLGLDRRLYPRLLQKLWRISRDREVNKQPVNLEVLWSYLRGKPELVER